MRRPAVAPEKRSTCSTRSFSRPLSCWMRTPYFSTCAGLAASLPRRLVCRADYRTRGGSLYEAARRGAGKAQHLFHQIFQPPALLLDEDAVLLHLRRIGGQFAAQISLPRRL